MYKDDWKWFFYGGAGTPGQLAQVHCSPSRAVIEKLAVQIGASVRQRDANAPKFGDWQFYYYLPE
jgi:hypothetical protein